MEVVGDRLPPGKSAPSFPARPQTYEPTSCPSSTASSLSGGSDAPNLSELPIHSAPAQDFSHPRNGERPRGRTSDDCGGLSEVLKGAVQCCSCQGSDAPSVQERKASWRARDCRDVLCRVDPSASFKDLSSRMSRLPLPDALDPPSS